MLVSLMEKENKKLREAARKKYTETVRALVDHVKQLDPRMERINKNIQERKLEKEERKRNEL